MVAFLSKTVPKSQCWQMINSSILTIFVQLKSYYYDTNGGKYRLRADKLASV